MGPTQVSAVLYGQNQTAAVQLQQTVQSLRDALFSAICEIKTLKEVNKALKDQLNLVDNGRKQTESQLQEELRQKNELLKKVQRKRQACTKVHIDCPDLLAQKDNELKRSEEERKARYEAPEASLQQELARRDEAWGSLSLIQRNRSGQD